MKKYNHQKVEKKWQKVWEKTGIFKANDRSKKPKFYSLDMFPYPSGQGLHVGHPRGYTASDIIAHFMRSRGYNVLRPMGWDAFGLPAENYAIKMGVHPEVSTKKNIKNIKKQIQSLGLSYDWSREINTTDPDYYKWTQWIFLQLFKKGLAYESDLPINWCPSCKTGLANEEVVNDGKCERCDCEVGKKNIRQWVLKITDYAERLLNDLELLEEWPEKIKEMQKNWIGKSEGWEIQFPISNFQFPISVFTTRTDTLFGCTYLVIAPENPIIENIKDEITNYKYVEEYIKKSKIKSERERISEVKEKTGVELKGIRAINPVNGREIPIFVADYVLAHYGTGAVMAVPAHDQRDFDFAKQYNLSVINVITSQINTDKRTDLRRLNNGAYEGNGVLINSEKFDGMKSEKAKEKIGEQLAEKNQAKKLVYYKLRDWVFSRQRYWGEPIPLIHCQDCGVVPLKEKDLPLKLPKVKKYKPTGTGESPLAAIKEWVNVKCPKCGGAAKRETNTMPQWAGSCWYYLRYLDSQNKKEIFSKKKERYWMSPASQSQKGEGGVDLYVGGVEHAVLHLLYARFWHKFLYDIGLVSSKEPFYKLRNQGLILAQDGQKMSKSKGNVVNPNEIIEKYGADTLRLYEMFIGPFDEPAVWNTGGIKGINRFLHKVWKLGLKINKKKNKSEKKLEKIIGKTVKKVTEDIENFKFNTAISSLMVLTNEMEKVEYLAKKDYNVLLKLLSPFAPHLTEELYQKIKQSGSVPEFNKKNSIHNQLWPKYDEKSLKEEEITLIIQVNSKFRDKITVQNSVSEEKIKEIVLSREKISKWLVDKEIKKIIFIPNKLINIVI